MEPSPIFTPELYLAMMGVFALTYLIREIVSAALRKRTIDANRLSNSTCTHSRETH